MTDAEHRREAWADLMNAAGRLIALDPAASSFARRDATCIVAIGPDARHDLDHWPPRSVARLPPHGDHGSGDEQNPV